jgi:ppGpp synthetase/RelA/SpoT-type nucleotidyltranferase
MIQRTHFGENILDSSSRECENEHLDMPRVFPRFSRKEVDRAGESLNRASPFSDEMTNCLEVISNWRSAHAYPLSLMRKTLAKRSRVLDGGALTAQRLKRLTSIGAKLYSSKTMKLSQVQDIGGCRAVLGDIKQVEQLVSQYIHTPLPCWEFYRLDDYVASPKADGYRSVHIVYKYRAITEEFIPYNKLRIEVQIRSRLQHAWATAVEAVSTFTEESVRSVRGNQDWKRFFALMGSALALREGHNAAPNTPDKVDGLREELRVISRKLKALECLKGWTKALQVIEERPSHTGAFLLALNLVERKLNVQGFNSKELWDGYALYAELEHRFRDDPGRQVVMVAVDSIEALKSAYPNYFLDTTAFTDALYEVIS